MPRGKIHSKMGLLCGIGCNRGNMQPQELGARLVLKIKTIVSVVVLALASGATWAADKVAVFNLERAILSTEAAKKASSDLQADPEFAALRAKYEGLVADMEKLRDEQNSKGMTWSTDQQAEHRKKVEYIRADLELAQKKLQAEQNAAVRVLMQELQSKTEKALEDVIKSEGISVVLNAAQVYHVDKKADITDKVTAKLDKMK